MVLFEWTLVLNQPIISGTKFRTIPFPLHHYLLVALELFRKMQPLRTYTKILPQFYLVIMELLLLEKLWLLFYTSYLLLRVKKKKKRICPSSFVYKRLKRHEFYFYITYNIEGSYISVAGSVNTIQQYYLHVAGIWIPDLYNGFVVRNEVSWLCRYVCVFERDDLIRS